MSLYYETVSSLLRETLQKISKDPIFKDFVLIGGTCLSLQLGHRRSIDIDLFTDMEYDSMETKLIKDYLRENFPYTEKTDSLDKPAMGYSLYIGNSPTDKVKVDLFYTEKFIFPVQELDNIRMADIREIAAMKIGAITQEEPRQKDFWDIHELSDKYSLKDMISWAIKRNEWAVSEDNILKGFQKIDSIKESKEGIDCLRGNYWSLVKDDLQEMVNEYIEKKEFMTAIEQGDISKLLNMKGNGFSLTQNIIDELQISIPMQKMVAIQTIFDLPTGISSIKLAHNSDMPPREIDNSLSR